jgi:hypothetical protein
MSTTVISHSSQPRFHIVSGARVTVALVLAAWFALVVALGANGVFVSAAGAPPLAIAIGAGLPIILFFAALRLSGAFRELVLTADLHLIVAIQSWRFAGLGFLALYAHKVLPAMFALPAGLGDMAIAIAAPWVLVSLIRRPRFATSTAFAAWNVLGILDLTAAVSSGALNSVLATGAAGEITTGPMALLPLLLIPVYLVPIFFMLHVTALMQARRLAKNPLDRA